MIVSGQSGTLVGQGSACNRGCGYRLASACVLWKCLICVRLETSGPQPAYPGLSGSSLWFRDTPASSTDICFFRGYLLLPRLFASSTTICFFHGYLLLRDVSLYMLGETCETWTLLGLSLGSDPFLLFTMSNITNIKSVLTHKGLDMFCHKFHIPWDVHPQLPSPNQTIHEMPTRKIGVYTRFFEYANFRLPLSTFLVNMLRHYRINLSQLSVIAAAKVSHFEILCRVHNIKPTVGLFRCFYINSKNKGWMSFSKRPDSDAVYMDLLAFIQVADPTKAKVGERGRAEGKQNFWIPPLFKEGGSADQRDSAAGGGQEAETELVTGVRIIADENVVAEKPKRPRKKRQAITDASGSSHPPKKLKGDHETSSGAATGGKSPSVLKELLANSSHHSSTNASGAEADFVIRSVVVPPVMTEAVITSHAVNAPSVPVSETVNADATGPSYSAKQDLSMGSRELNAETLRQVFVLQWNVLNDSLLDDSYVSREFIDHLAPPALFSQIRKMDYHYLFTEFNVGIARQAFLNEAKDDEVENLKARLLLKETEAAEAARLRAQNEKDSLDGKVAELQSSVSAKDLELKDLNVVVSSLRCMCWRLHAPASAIRSLVDVAAYNPMRKWIKFRLSDIHEVDYLASELISTIMQQLRYYHLLPARRIRENVAAKRSVLIGVWTHLVDPLSAENLVGAAGTSDSVPATIATTTALSTTFASASSVPPITIEDYEIVGADGPKNAQTNGQGNVASFPIVEFEKEEPDTTPERDPPN
ncbi:hypothetical protein Tco_0813823 [Tanacetum coccineum]